MIAAGDSDWTRGGRWAMSDAVRKLKLWAEWFRRDFENSADDAQIAWYPRVGYDYPDGDWCLTVGDIRALAASAPAGGATGERTKDAGWLLVDENLRLISLLGRLFRYTRQLEDSRREITFAERDNLFEEIEAAMTYSLGEFDARETLDRALTAPADAREAERERVIDWRSLLTDAKFGMDQALSKQHFWECDCEPTIEYDTNACIHQESCAVLLEGHFEATADWIRMALLDAAASPESAEPAPPRVED